MTELAEGDSAPDIVVQDATGKNLHLSELWRERTLVLVFLRHFG
jgi:peroxiredoxin